MQISRLRAACILVAGTFVIQVASAQVDRSGGGVNAQLAQQYQQVLAERLRLQTENSKLKKDLDDASRQLQAATLQLKRARANAAAVQAAQTALSAAQAASQSNAHSLEIMRSKSEELVGHFRDTVATLKGVESERAQLSQQLLQARAALDRCADRNYQLYQINSEVLDRYQHQGVFSHVAQAEPFTRIKRTQIDNLVLEDRQRVEELRVEKQKASDKGSAAGASEAAPAP